jgi:hypothetical protein
VQLVHGKLPGDWTSFNFTEASSRIAFQGNRASVEFFNVATKEVDVSLRGEIDFDDINDVKVRMSGATPIFDLTSHQIGCVNKIEIAPAVLTLAPAVAELEFRGGLFQSGWTVSLHEGADLQFLGISDPNSGSRRFPLCLRASPEEKPLLLGAPPWSGTGSDTTRPKRKDKRR